MFIFPGLGLGATVAGATRVSDRMLYVAAEALANSVTNEELGEGKVFPHIGNIREVSKNVAIAVAREAYRIGEATKLRKRDMFNLDDYISKKMYDPVYVPLVEKREVTI